MMSNKRMVLWAREPIGSEFITTPRSGLISVARWSPIMEVASRQRSGSKVMKLGS